MRQKPHVLLVGLALVVFLAIAVAQSANFSSLTTGVSVLTADSSHGRVITIPLPYREAQRTLLAPVPAGQFDKTWSVELRAIEPHSGHVTED